MAWQMDAKRAFRVEKAIKTAVLGDLDTETFVLNAPDDLLDWIDSTIVGAAFEGSASPASALLERRVVCLSSSSERGE